MKKTIALCLLSFCLHANAQLMATDTTYYPKCIIEEGLHIPLGRLADKIGPSPEIGLWRRNRIVNNDMLDVGFTLYMPMQKKEFDYKTPDSVYRVKAKGVSGMVGVRMCKIYTIGGKSVPKKMEWVSSFGYAFFIYHDKEAQHLHETYPEDYKDSKNSSYTKAFSTFHIGQGIRVDIANVAVQLHYNYTPYGLLTTSVPNNFGSHSLTAGLLFKL